MSAPSIVRFHVAAAVAGLSVWIGACSSADRQAIEAGYVSFAEYKWPSRDYSDFRCTELQGECEGKTWTANVLVPKGERTDAVLWYFHGGYGSPDIRSAISGKGFWEGWHQLGAAKPMVIALTLGPRWLANTENLAVVRQARHDLLAQFALTHSRQWLLGVSMGGFNGLQLLIAEQGETHAFDRAVLVSPGFTPCPPYRDDGLPMTWADCVRGSHVDGHTDQAYLEGWLELTRDFFPTAESWERFSPNARARQLRDPSVILILAGDRDPFGFDVGVRRFAEISGCRVVMNPRGKHKLSSTYGTRIGEFLVSSKLNVISK